MRQAATASACGVVPPAIIVLHPVAIVHLRVLVCAVEELGLALCNGGTERERGFAIR